MQVRCINDPVIVQKDVQIQCARSPADQALPMGFLLYPVQSREQFRRGKECLKFQGSVEKSSCSTPP